MPKYVISRLAALILVPVFTIVGCASTDFASDRQARSAVDVPDHFMVGMPNSTATTAPKPGEGCRSPMVDPRDGARLVLVRSLDDRGDYKAPAGRYGLGDGELLRLECSTGRVIGVVPL